MRATLIYAALVASVLAVAPGQAQQAPSAAAPPIKRTVLQKFDVPGTSYETVIGIAEIASSTNIGRHTHPRSGERGARVIATYVVEKGKPLASPAH